MERLRIGIIGCGKIAEAHASQIQRVPGSEMTGAMDAEILMAKQLAERYGIRGHYDDFDEFLAGARPHVVHITTPPQSHYGLGMRALESGCHVYMEKPFTLNAREAGELIRCATDRNLKITVGHDEQFSKAARRMRECIRSGYLGGPPVHMESHYFYDLGDPQDAKAFLADRSHWIRQLPGALLQNNISHGIAPIAEYLDGATLEVNAQGYTSEFLRNLGETEIIDELRVILRDRSCTAYFTFSSQMHPTVRQFHVYGLKNGLFMNQGHQIFLKIRGDKFKSYLDRFLPPALFAGQYMSNAWGNVNSFLRRDFHMKAGMKYLIEAFYRSIAEDRPVPIPYSEILLTSSIMDRILTQIKG